ncbi:MAG: hypothetical protein IJK43_05040 [Prevotella sp.]|nr:hypothetical protein [Prevotella sp.]
MGIWWGCAILMNVSGFNNELKQISTDMTLHEAVTKAIHDLGGGKLHIKDVADYINSHHLYERGDKNPVPVNQISARLNKYQHMFCRANGYIWIISE